MSFYNPLPRRKHSQTSFYMKTQHCQPSPLKDNTQNIIRMQQKEIERLEHQNRNLQILAENQSKLIYQERQIKIMPPIKEAVILSQQNTKPNSIKQRIEVDKPQRLQRKNTINRRLTVLFQQDDTFKLNNVLDLNTTDEELIGAYQNDGSLQLIDETLNDEDCFLDVIHNYPPQKVSIVYDKLKKIYQEHNIMFQIILKLKTLIQRGFIIQNSKLLDESFYILKESVSQVMNSQDVKIYLIDEEKKELYSRQDNQKYKIGEGIIGHVAESKQVLNLKKAKYDTRFQNVQGNVILAAPILDNQKCYGVIVCYEKKTGGIYTEEDESLLQLLTEQGKMILSNVMNHNQLIMAVNKFRHALKSSIQFNKINDQQQLIQFASSRLKEMMNSEIATIRLYDDINNQGIMGQALQSKQILFFNNCYNCQYFNPVVDLNTQLPVITVPIIDQNIKIGCAQFTQMRGIVQQSSLSSIEQEVLELFLLSFGSLVQK